MSLDFSETVSFTLQEYPFDSVIDDARLQIYSLSCKLNKTESLGM